jgi:hypothetical protein
MAAAIVANRTSYTIKWVLVATRQERAMAKLVHPARVAQRPS